MPYICGGAVVEARSPYRLSIVADAFWWIVNLVGLFFGCLLPTYGKKGETKQRLRGGGGAWGGGDDAPPPHPPPRRPNRHTASETLAAVECHAGG